jgi:transcriptional regulator with XRE-family HTH domain
MIRFRDDLKKKLKDKKFAEGFEKELHAARLAVEIAQAREKQGMTQSALAFRARITQQQLSKVENAKACKVETLFKVCDALGMELTLKPREAGSRGAAERPIRVSRATTKRTGPRARPLARSTGKRVAAV